MGAILSAALMLETLGRHEEARAIERAVEARRARRRDDDGHRRDAGDERSRRRDCRTASAAAAESGSGATPGPTTRGSHHMAKDVFIVGGARTPMTDYVGALKDVSALELGAIAARGAFEQDRRQAGMGRSRGRRQRAADQQRRHLRRAPRRAQGRRADRGAGADRQPAVRLGHPGGGQRRAADPARTRPTSCSRAASRA